MGEKSLGPTKIKTQLHHWCPVTILDKKLASLCFFTGQDDWNGAVANKLHFVKPVLGDWQFCYRHNIAHINPPAKTIPVDKKFNKIGYSDLYPVECSGLVWLNPG